MKPPQCAYCHKRFKASNRNLVKFADYQALPERMVGHPKGMLWFCGEHIEKARQLKDLPSKDALRLMSGV